ncbi:MAG: SGNH/GDSL hydrolase family protein [Bacteroidales bacterium]|nr:SGNH/GDSL hydrolase family protein [Bacteroidales bacterium]
MRLKLSILAICGIIFGAYHSSAQTRWLNPADQNVPLIQQQGFPSELGNSYHRLPDRFRESVPGLVWQKSANASGLAIYFYTNAPEIQVRYTVSEDLNTPDMSTIGTSGCDLRYIDPDGAGHDLFMDYAFSDTIRLAYRHLDTSLQHEYRLYLPLYNTVEWLEIGVPEASSFKFAAPREEKPIVIYGTSICQGGNTSRAGNSWTNLLSQYLDWPVVNFGFDGSGKMEKEVVEAVREVDASVYVLDNLYNLTEFPVQEKVDRIVRSVRLLKERWPDTPIIIAGHTGHNSPSHAAQRDSSNKAAALALDIALKDGLKDIYLLSFDGLGMDSEGSTVEGVHLNDHGMMELAKVYERYLRNVLRLPDGGEGITHGVTQRRMPQIYDWQERHTEILRGNAQDPPANVILGDSIIHYWGGASLGDHGIDTWNERFAPLSYKNLGMAWDNIENILWRVNHGEIDGFEAGTVLVEAGSNNTDENTDEEIVEGVVFLLKSIRLHQPKARIKYIAILPCAQEETRIRILNRKLKKAVLKAGFDFCDPGPALLTKGGVIDRRLFVDDAHPNSEGYKLIVDDILK